MKPGTVAVFSDAHAPGDRRAESARRLEALKQRIVETMPDRVRDYEATWDAAKGVVTGLDAFGQRVLEDLWAALDAETRAFVATDPASWQEQERATLDEFVQRHVVGFVGRSELLNHLCELPIGPGDGSCGVCITGEAGLGKSALFASLYRRLTAEGVVLVLAHSAGISPRSPSADSLQRRWIQELACHLGMPDPAEPIDRREELEELLANLLSQVAAHTRTVLLLDALDQFEPTPCA